MSDRETRLAPITLNTIGGIDERVYPTELKPQEYSALNGVFPEFAGLQSRLFGKRLLAKYAGALYGIYQFWTPMGYGVGLYQFTGTLDYGVWLTPVSAIVLDSLPGGYDGGDMTLDDFGQGYGENFGYSNVNTCVLSFLNGSSNHSSCNPAASPAATPNDSNGGPAGQGRHCRWTTGTQTVAAMPAPKNTMFGTWTIGGNNPSGPTPYPVQPTQSTQRPTAYSPGSSPFGNIWFAQCDTKSAKFQIVGGNWIETQQADSQNTLGTLDLSSLVDPANPPSSIEFQVRHNASAPFDLLWVGFGGPAPTDYSNIPLDVWGFIRPSYRTDPNPAGGGFVISDFIQIQQVRLNYNGRVCT